MKFKSFPQNPNLSLKFLRRPSKEGLLVVVREKVRKKARSRRLARSRKKERSRRLVRSRKLAKKRKKPTFLSGVKLVPRIEKMDNFLKISYILRKK